jgi:hypothetical protein
VDVAVLGGLLNDEKWAAQIVQDLGNGNSEKINVLSLIAGFLLCADPAESFQAQTESIFGCFDFAGTGVIDCDVLTILLVSSTVAVSKMCDAMKLPLTHTQNCEALARTAFEKNGTAGMERSQFYNWVCQKFSIEPSTSPRQVSLQELMDTFLWYPLTPAATQTATPVWCSMPSPTVQGEHFDMSVLGVAVQDTDPASFKPHSSDELAFIDKFDRKMRIKFEKCFIARGRARVVVSPPSDKSAPSEEAKSDSSRSATPRTPRISAPRSRPSSSIPPGTPEVQTFDSVLPQLTPLFTRYLGKDHSAFSVAVPHAHRVWEKMIPRWVCRGTESFFQVLDPRVIANIDGYLAKETARDFSQGATQQGHQTLASHEDMITGCDWSPDGTLILSSSADSTLKVLLRQ